MADNLIVLHNGKMDGGGAPLKKTAAVPGVEQSKWGGKRLFFKKKGGDTHLCTEISSSVPHLHIHFFFISY